VLLREDERDSAADAAGTARDDANLSHVVERGSLT